MIWQVVVVLVFVVFIMIIAYKKLLITNNLLEESIRNFETLFHSTRDIVVIVNKDLKIVMINQTGLDTFGYTEDEIYNLCVKDFTKPENSHTIELLQKFRSKINFELDLYTKEGKIVHLLAKGQDIIYKGEVSRVSILTNITDIKNSQKRLIDLNHSLEDRVAKEVKISREKDKKMLEQSRLAQMGEMISMIAHQWRQPLATVASTTIDIKLSLMLQKYDLENAKQREEFQEYMDLQLDYIETNIQNLTKTVDNFGNFYKPDTQSKMMLINEPLEKSLDLLKNLIEQNHVEINIELKSKKELKIFHNEMVQVFLNIIKNAIDNLNQKKIKYPSIIIESKDTEKGLNLTICDNGGGVSEDIILNIFDPYFSTKNEKDGVGLGLYMSKMIIEKHHKGSLKVKNRESGACFSIKM